MNLSACSMPSFRSLWESLVKKATTYTGALPLPTDFPVDEKPGSSKLTQWYTDNDNYHWKRMFCYLKYVASSWNDISEEFKGKEEKVYQLLLDIALTGSVPKVKINGVDTKVGLSNYGSTPPNGAYTVGRIEDSSTKTAIALYNNPALPAKITFNGAANQYFIQPVIDNYSKSSNVEAVIFPVITLPEAADNDGGHGTRFLDIEFKFPSDVFDCPPGTSTVNGDLKTRVNGYNEFTTILDKIKNNSNIGNNDRNKIYAGIMSLFTSAMNNRPTKETETLFTQFNKNSVSSKLCPAVQDSQAGADIDTGVVGNAPQSDIVWDLTVNPNLQPDVFWNSVGVAKGGIMEYVQTNVYYGYDSKLYSDDDGNGDPSVSGTDIPDYGVTEKSWFPAPSDNLLPPNVFLNNQYCRPTIFYKVTDRIIFDVDDTSDIARLNILDRVYVLQQTQSDTPEEYHFYPGYELNLRLQQKNGLRIFTTPLNVNEAITVPNVSILDGTRDAFTMGLQLSIISKIITNEMAKFNASNTDDAAIPEFTEYSAALYAASDNTYRSSINDLLIYCLNGYSSTNLVSLTPSGFSIEQVGSVTILNPDGVIVAMGEAHNAPRTLAVVATDIYANGIYLRGCWNTAGSSVTLTQVTFGCGESGDVAALSVEQIYQANANYSTGAPTSSMDFNRMIGGHGGKVVNPKSSNNSKSKAAPSNLQATEHCRYLILQAATQQPFKKKQSSDSRKKTAAVASAKPVVSKAPNITRANLLPSNRPTYQNVKKTPIIPKSVINAHKPTPTPAPQA
jgi:hypothetical protein